MLHLLFATQNDSNSLFVVDFFNSLHHYYYLHVSGFSVLHSENSLANVFLQICTHLKNFKSNLHIDCKILKNYAISTLFHTYFV